MERQQEISKAKSLLRDLQNTVGKRRHRIHENAREDNSHRLRALNGICGECKNVDIVFRIRDGKQAPAVFCKAGMDPLHLYRDTKFGDTPDCNFFEPSEDN